MVLMMHCVWRKESGENEPAFWLAEAVLSEIRALTRSYCTVWAHEQVISSSFMCFCLWLGALRHFLKVQAFHWYCGSVTLFLDLLLRHGWWWWWWGVSMQQSIQYAEKYAVLKSSAPKHSLHIGILPNIIFLTFLDFCAVEIGGCLKCS